ncbi:MAG: hypothetical protein IPK12_01670 [Gemmatimonadetes bacterium]|nr:hypothetical protein [Gemmatimonadota bacterium]
MPTSRRYSVTVPRRAGALPLLGALWLGACVDRPSATGPQFPFPEVHGAVVDGIGVGQLGGTVSGVSGITRELRGDTLGTYRTTILDLEPPFIVQATTAAGIGLAAIALDSGLVNLSPLTTLAYAQALLDDSLARLDRADLDAAQATMAAYLAATEGFTVTTGAADWATTPFTPVAGDPMYDQIVALNATLDANGSSVDAIVTRLSLAAILCRQGQLVLGNAASGKFCPATRVTGPDATDSTVTSYLFLGDAGDSLVVRAQGGVVLQVSFVRGGAAYSCLPGGCAGVAIGAPTGAGARPISFAGTSLAGAQPLTLSGTVTAAPDGVTLPPLYCEDNRLVLIRPDRSADVACLPAAGMSVAGTYTVFGLADGVPQFRIDVALRGAELRHVIYSHYDANFALSADFACEGAGCDGVTVGPLVQDDAGFNNRRLTFDNTQLGAVNADSTVSGTSFASLTLSFPSQVLDLGDAGFPPPPDCAGLDSVRVSYSDTTPAMAICPPAFDSTVGTVWVGSYQQADGEPGYFVQDANFDNIAVNLQGTAIREVLVSTGGTNGMAGGCAGIDCTGVTVSAPDSLGEVTISFAGTLLREAAPGVKLTTLRTLSLSGTVGRFPPVPVPVPPALRRRARLGRAGPR